MTGLLGLLGVGCPIIFIPSNEYGVPHADYTVKGAVVNEADNAPISGIRVGFSPTEWDEDAFGTQPEYSWKPDIYVLTNANGEFRLTGSFFPDRNKILPVFVEDVESGSFQSKMFEVSFENVRPVGGHGNWYAGEYIVTTTFHLTKVKVE